MYCFTKLFGNFRSNQSGLAAVEFGLFFPIFVFLVFGGYATFTVVQTNRAVERTSTVLSDLTSRLSFIDQTTATNLIEIGKSLSGAVAEGENYKIKLSSISNTFDAFDKYDLVIDWSYTNKSGDELKISELDDHNLPHIPEGESVILVTVEAEYVTTFYEELHGLLALEQSSVRRPRFVPLVIKQ